MTCIDHTPIDCEAYVRYIVFVDGVSSGGLSFTSDGKYIAFSEARDPGFISHENIEQVSLENFQRSTITEFSSIQPTWSQNGNVFVFTSYSDGSMEGDLFYLSDQITEPALLTDYVHDSYDADVSLDGKYIVFCSSEGTKYEGTWKPILYVAA